MIKDLLNEVLITFGKKAYPQFNNVVILAGGAGSGKGFIKNKLLGIEGYTYDVDEIKSLALRSKSISKKLRDDYGLDTSIPNFLRNPDNVSRLHNAIKDMGLDTGNLGRLYQSISLSNQERKPNIIFDVTLQSLKKLHSISVALKDIGYKKEDIHLVWIITPVSIAIDRNKERDRVVPEEVLINTHEGVSLTINQIVNLGDKLDQYMDGDIYFIFNNTTDVIYFKSDQTKNAGYLDSATFFKIKEKGKPVDKSKISQSVVDKIVSYTPPPNIW